MVSVGQSMMVMIRSKFYPRLLLIHSNFFCSWCLSFPFLHSVASLTNTHCDWLTATTFQLTLPFSNQDGCLGDEAPCSPFSPSPSYKLSPSGSTLPNVSLGAIGTGLNPQNFAARQVRRPLKFITAWLWPRLGPGLQFIASFVCLGKFVDYWMHRMILSLGFLFSSFSP